MTRFAEGTTVDPEKSRQELIRTLERYGASSFVEARQTKPQRYAVQFQLLGRWYRFSIEEKPPITFKRTSDRYWPDNELLLKHPGWYKQEWATLTKRQQDEWRRQWRVLINHVKLLMDMALDDAEGDVAGGHTHDVLLPFLLLPGGETFAEHYAPQVDRLYDSGEHPDPLVRLLPDHSSATDDANRGAS